MPLLSITVEDILFAFCVSHTLGIKCLTKNVHMVYLLFVVIFLFDMCCICAVLPVLNS